MRRPRSLLLLTLLLGPVAAAGARDVRIPLTVAPAIVRDALVAQVFTAPGARALFWGEPGGCNFFYLEDPRVEGREGDVLVTAHGEARLGTEFLGGCLSPIVWSGNVEVIEKPRSEGWTLLFDVVDSNLYDERGEKTLLGGGLWDRIKDSVHPRLGAVKVDLGAPFEQLRGLLPLLVSVPDAGDARRMLDSLRPVAAAATPRGVVIEAALEVAEPPTPAVAAPEPPLSDAEIAAFAERLNQWDAFVTFVVRELGRKTLPGAARDALLETLLDARYGIVSALDSPRRHDDPVRRLFLQSWENLRPVADDIARGLPGAEAVRILTFVAAGDALVVLDQVGPSFGIEISADGLRRMARMVGPDAEDDPLDYTPRVDPRLRLFMGFGSPIEAESLPDEGPGSWLFPASAFAAEVDRSAKWQGWLFDGPGDVDAYLARVAKLLRSTGGAMVKKEKLVGTPAELFERLLAATAWQESCWRQFLRKGGGVTYLRSSRASVGMLQVNERVWRGFYDVESLRWDIAYNARAGSDILLRYLRMVLDRRKAALTKEELPRTARLVYAAYNGGPGQLRRYLDPKLPGKKLARVIDRLFGEKFDGGRDGMEARVARCLVGGA